MNKRQEDKARYQCGEYDAIIAFIKKWRLSKPKLAECSGIAYLVFLQKYKGNNERYEFTVENFVQLKKALRMMLDEGEQLIPKQRVKELNTH